VEEVSAPTCSHELPSFFPPGSLAEVNLLADLGRSMRRGMKSSLARVNLETAYPQPYLAAEAGLFQKYRHKCMVFSFYRGK